MKLDKNRNWIAVAIAGLALAVAATGTAAAVTSATTTISDPTIPAQKAKVDTSGRLQTFSAPVTSSLAYATNFYNASVTLLTSPTTANLVVTNVLLSETRLNGTISGSDLTVRLAQFLVNGDGSCSTVPSRYIAVASLSSGQSVQLASSVPFLAKPVGGAKYCLGLTSVTTSGAPDGTTYYPTVTFSAYVSGGTYTGVGASGTTLAALPAKKAR